MTAIIPRPDAAREIVARQGDAPARNAGIDVLRGLVTLLVVLHHTALTYGAIGGWYYREVRPDGSPANLLLVLFCTTNQAWFMGFFFLLAGYYTPAAFERRGLRVFARERLLRLGVPLVVEILLIHPVAVSLAQIAQGRSFLRVFEYLYAHARLEPGPLWFAEALLLFTAVFLAWRLLPGRPAPSTPSFPSDGALLGSALATGAAAFLIRLLWPVGTTLAFLQLGYFASYAVLFWAGCVGARSRWLDGIPPRRAARWLIVSALAFPVFPLVDLLGKHVVWLGGRAEGGWSVEALTYAVWEPFVAWGIILALLATAQRRVAQLDGVLSRLSRRAFAIYVIHAPILVGVALVLRPFSAPALVKFALTGSLACALCYGTAGLLLRIPGVARVL